MTARRFDWARFSRNPNATDAWALSSDTSLVKELYASIASEGTKTFEELRSDVDFGTIPGWDATWVARLARIISVQPFHGELGDFALRAFRVALPLLPRDRTTLKLRRTFFELLYLAGIEDEARQLLDEDAELDSIYYGYLRTDTINPYTVGKSVEKRTWLERFNQPFVQAGLAPVGVDDTKATPFDGLHSTANAAISDGPLVSVVLTTYNPEPSEITTAVRSILNQTWRNLEVLIVDDHSDERFLPAINALAGEDERIRIIRLPVNGGTYRARNRGISEARGKYFTGQDTDDWSHPERIEREVEALEANECVPGVTTSANRTNSNLVRASLGNNPHRSCEVSLMVRTETARQIGGYLPVRKAGDSEFRARLERWWGASVQHLDEPLYLIRLSQGSLSRADFRPGWSHHARRAFWSTYTDWHTHASRDELEIDPRDPEIRGAKMAPVKIAGAEWARPQVFDVCIVADWRGSTSQQRAALDELRALVDSDYNVAILHVDTPWGGSSNWRALSPQVQRLVTTGKVERIQADEQATIDLLVVRDPATADFGLERRMALSVNKVLMLAHGDPSGDPSTFMEYDPENAHRVASIMFGQPPVWIVPDGQNAKQFCTVYGLPASSTPYPYVVEVPTGRRIRSENVGGRVVIGRPAVNSELAWPDRDSIEEIYPTDGSVEVRVLGDARAAARILEERHVPAEWIDFREGTIEPHQFWRTVDALVLFNQGGENRAYDRHIYAALAAGTVVVTDPCKAEAFRDVVLAASPSEALSQAIALIYNRDALNRYRSEAYNFASSRAGTQQYLSFIRKLLEDRVVDERN